MKITARRTHELRRNAQFEEKGMRGAAFQSVGVYVKLSDGLALFWYIVAAIAAVSLGRKMTPLYHLYSLGISSDRIIMSHLDEFD